MTTELRCSPAVRALGVDPVGSAAAGSSYLLVDVPLPWPSDIGDDPRLDALHAYVRELSAAGHRWRVQATVPHDDGPHRVVAYELPTGMAAGFRRRERTVTGEDAVAAGLELLQQVGVDGVGATVSDGGDFLLCTHGSRDVCCGGSGTLLWRELHEGTPVLPPELRLGRTSHTGGHRFAPTAVLLPSGTVWAWLDLGLVATITHRSGAVDDVLAHYRGSCLLPSPAEQLVEREAFRAIGWGWLDHRRVATSSADGEHTVVAISYESPDGTSGSFTGRTAVVGTSPVPQCGEPLDAAPKSAPVLELVGEVEHRTG